MPGKVGREERSIDSAYIDFRSGKGDWGKHQPDQIEDGRKSRKPTAKRPDYLRMAEEGLFDDLT
jgi:hypothetical protein